MTPLEDYTAPDEHTRQVRNNLFTDLFANRELNLTDSEWKNTKRLTAGVLIGAIAALGVSIYDHNNTPDQDQRNGYIAPEDPQVDYSIDTK